MLVPSEISLLTHLQKQAKRGFSARSFSPLQIRGHVCPWPPSSHHLNHSNYINPRNDIISNHESSKPQSLDSSPSGISKLVPRSFCSNEDQLILLLNLPAADTMTKPHGFGFDEECGERIKRECPRYYGHSMGSALSF